MKALSDPLFIFYALVMVVWLGRAKRALQTLEQAPAIKPGSYPASKKNPFVTVFVPAKNEENNIRQCVESLLRQDYENYEIIVINDNSVDKTEDILKELGAVTVQVDQDQKDIRLKYLNSAPAPSGWTGKNHALHSAIPYAAGDWFLFTDADTYHEPTCLRACTEHNYKNKLSLLTLLPRCLTKSFWEDAIQPSAMCLTGLWFPIEKVNDPNSKVYFGNGQFLMMSRKVYQKTGGHLAVKEAFLEDFALVKKAKDKSFAIQVAFGTSVYGTRMYDSLATIWRGWRRIYLHAFNSQPLILIQKIGSVICFSALPFLLFIPVVTRALSEPERFGLTMGFAVPTLGFIIAIVWKSYRLVKGKSFYAIFHPLAACYLGLVLGDAAIMAYTGRKTVWR